MKKIIINKLMDFIKNNNPQYNDEKLAEIRYGLEGLYLTLSKTIIIALVAIILNIFTEFIIFLILYNVVRMPSFGLHATKSWICLLSSTIIFIGFPLISKYIIIPIYIKALLGVILLYQFYKNAPADTKKRPIINPKRRLVYKYLSIIVAIIFIYCSIMIKNNFLSNCFILTLLVQSFMISPYVYKMFGLPYDNYKNYLTNSI